jgi:metal-dependent HD superfamily phosphatase/phosphodiesterase
MITFEAIKKDETIKTYIKKADASLAALGYTEHSFAHVGKVADTARYILETLGADAKTVELAQIAGYTHDIGNLVNRKEHSQSGAIMMFRLLDHKDMPPEDIATVVTAIGNHDEGTGVPVDAVSAALILADKSDVRRSRVRNIDPSKFDIHDRVNYSVTESKLNITPESKEITLTLTIDIAISSVMDYFEIFLGRMIMCRKAADFLGLAFRLVINGQIMM